MSVGNNLQEMENVVTKGAAKADPMPKLTTGGTPASYEDLGGPTPQNSKPDDDSNKLKTPGTSLKQVKDVVNKGAKSADPMPAGMKEEEEVEGEVVAETEVSEDEVVSEEEDAVAEHHTTDEDGNVIEHEEEEVVAESEQEEEMIDVEQDIQALLEGEELSEEFQNKARTIFEAAIRTKLSEIKEQVKVSYEEKLVEEVASIKEELKDRVDSYLEYVADEWVQENKIAIEHGLKSEMTESFLEGMRGLFEEHYVTIPEEKYDVIESMVDKLDEMEDKLNEQIEKNVALNKRLSESTADVIFADVTEGLAQTQRDKLASLIENVEFESEESYREKISTLRKSYFPDNAGVQRDNSENLTEGNQAEVSASVSSTMEAYLKTLGRVSKK
tara:strand:- start:739 stop:1896 length:1158 start_codon:yes stop_codon:yes gene_type:complete